MRLQKISKLEEIQDVFTLAENGNFQQDFVWGEFQKSLGRDILRYVVLDDEDKNIFYVHTT